MTASPTTPTPAIAEGEPPRLEACPWGCPAKMHVSPSRPGIGGREQAFWVECDRPPESHSHIVQTQPYATEAEAIAAWNRRPSPEGRREVLEELPKMLAAFGETGPDEDGFIDCRWCHRSVHVDKNEPLSHAYDCPIERLANAVAATQHPAGVTRARPLAELRDRIAAYLDPGALQPSSSLASAHSLLTEARLSLDAALQATPARTGEGPLTREEVEEVVDVFWQDHDLAAVGEKMARDLGLDEAHDGETAIAWLHSWQKVRGSLRTGEGEDMVTESLRDPVIAKAVLNEAIVDASRAALEEARRAVAALREGGDETQYARGFNSCVGAAVEAIRSLLAAPPAARVPRQYCTEGCPDYPRCSHASLPPGVLPESMRRSSRAAKEGSEGR